MTDLFAEQLEMLLRFAEEKAQEREMIAYEQGRADAIDECIKTITNFCGGLPNINIIGALERLKEQKNGKVCDECYDCKYYIDNTDEYFECTGQDKPCSDFIKLCDECYDCKYYIDNTDEYFECTGQDKPCCDFVEVEQLKEQKND